MSDDLGYIMSLREVIGHRPIIMSCAGVLLLDEHDRVLLVRRADNGMWAYPGGSMELGESFEQCAARELTEETGLVCEKLDFFTTVSGEAVHYTYPNGDEIYAAEVIYLCRDYKGCLNKQESEVSDMGFFDVDSLPDITPNNRLVLERLKGYLEAKS